MAPALRTIPLACLAALVLALAACGSDSGDETSAAATTPTTATDAAATDATATATTGAGSDSAEPISTTPSVSDSCSDVETFAVEPSGDHSDRDFTIADYPTNPPTSGDHNPNAIQPGKYSSPPPLGEAVHLLEHGAVIGWTNGLSAEQQKTVEDAFNVAFQQGHYQIATVELPELDGSFAMSSWDSLQFCDPPDPKAIVDFIENHYAPATTAEAALACTGAAANVPACKELDG